MKLDGVAVGRVVNGIMGKGDQSRGFLQQNNSLLCIYARARERLDFIQRFISFFTLFFSFIAHNPSCVILNPPAWSVKVHQLGLKRVEGQWWSCRQGESSRAVRTYTRIYVTGCLKVLASSVMGHGLVSHADTWPESYAFSVPVFVLHTTYHSVDSMRKPWWDGVGFVCKHSHEVIFASANYRVTNLR